MCSPVAPQHGLPGAPALGPLGRMDLRASGWWACPPWAWSVGGPCGAQVFPQTLQAFPRSSLRGEHPHLHPPHPHLCPEPGETVTSVPVPFAGGTGWRDVPLPRPRVEGGLWGVRGFPPSSERVVGPGEAAGPTGRLRACLGQGGEAPWSRGRWTPGAQESRPGAGQTLAEGADGLPLLVQAQPWGTVGSRLPSRAPFPAPGGQEAHASWRPEPGSAI